MFASWLYCKYFGHQRQAIHLRKRACIWWPDITTEAFNIFILKAIAIYEIKPIKRYSWSMPKHFRPSGCHFHHRSYHTPPAFSITSLSRTNCVDFGQIQSISYKNCGGISPPPPPLRTNLGMCQSPLKWFTWLQTSTTSNPTARLIGPWPWKPRVGSSPKSVREAVQGAGFVEGKMPTWPVPIRVTSMW